jgi:RsiW-degrading membrane proteinase PrsW (M82 family)
MDSIFAVSGPELVIVAVIVLLIVFSWREPPASFWRQLGGQFDQLGHELDRRFDRRRWMQRLPVFSAETIHGKEAEFIRERLPRKPLARFVVLLFLIGAFLWLFARQFG